MVSGKNRDLCAMAVKTLNALLKLGKEIAGLGAHMGWHDGTASGDTTAMRLAFKLREFCRLLGRLVDLLSDVETNVDSIAMDLQEVLESAGRPSPNTALLVRAAQSVESVVPSLTAWLQTAKSAGACGRRERKAYRRFSKAECDRVREDPLNIVLNVQVFPQERKHWVTVTTEHHFALPPLLGAILKVLAGAAARADDTHSDGWVRRSDMIAKLCEVLHRPPSEHALDMGVSRIRNAFGAHGIGTQHLQAWDGHLRLAMRARAVQ